MMEGSMMPVYYYWPYRNVVLINPVYPWYYYNLNPLLVKVLGAEKAMRYHQVPTSFNDLEHFRMPMITNNNISYKNEIINIDNDSEVDIPERSYHFKGSISEDHKEVIKEKVYHQPSHYDKSYMEISQLQYDERTEDILKLRILLPNKQKTDKNRTFSECSEEEQKDIKIEIKHQDLSINLENTNEQLVQINNTEKLKIFGQEQEQSNQLKSEQDYEEVNEQEEEKIEEIKNNEESSLNDISPERSIHMSVSKRSSDIPYAPKPKIELREYICSVIVSKLDRQIKVDSGVLLKKGIGRTRNNELVHSQTVYKCVRNYIIHWINSVGSNKFNSIRIDAWKTMLQRKIRKTVLIILYRVGVRNKFKSAEVEEYAHPMAESFALFLKIFMIEIKFDELIDYFLEFISIYFSMVKI